MYNHELLCWQECLDRDIVWDQRKITEFQSSLKSKYNKRWPNSLCRNLNFLFLYIKLLLSMEHIVIHSAVINADPFTSIHVSCWRQYCNYISTSVDSGLMVGRPLKCTLGICGKTLKHCQVDERGSSNHHLAQRALEKNRREIQSTSEPLQPVRDTRRNESSIITSGRGTLPRTVRVQGFQNASQVSIKCLWYVLAYSVTPLVQ